MVNFEADIERCLEVLHSGGIILYPTDTVWGLGCDSTNEEAVAKLFELKRRTDEKAMIILVTDQRDVLKHTSSPDLELFGYLEQATKPTTVIYQGAIGLAPNLIGKDGSIAIRICKDQFCRHLITRFRKPIVSTSANFSGEETPAIFSAVSEQIINGVDYVVTYRQLDNTVHAPSAVIRWDNGVLNILRP